MRISFAILLLFAASPSPLWADARPGSWDGNYLKFLDPSQKQPPIEMKTLLASKVPSVKAASDLTWTVLGSSSRIRQYQGVQVVGLYRAGFNGIEGLAAPGDWIREIHVGPIYAIESIYLIDAKTGIVSSIPLLHAH